MFGIRRVTKEFCATLREISDEHSHLMAENEKLRAENNKLRAENNKLRKLVQDIWSDGMTLGTACKLKAENIRMHQLVARMYRDMQGVLDRSTDTVFVDRMMTLRDCMDVYMECMAELGMPPCDYESRRRELGIEVEDA